MPYRCVIADDHPAIIDGVSRYLADVDDVELVASAENGDEALRLIEKHAPDVAVVDIRMPGVDRYSEIADALSLSSATVRKLTRIKTKLGAATPTEAVAVALRLSLIT